MKFLTLSVFVSSRDHLRTPIKVFEFPSERDTAVDTHMMKDWLLDLKFPFEKSTSPKERHGWHDWKGPKVIFPRGFFQVVTLVEAVVLNAPLLQIRKRAEYRC